MSEPTQYFKTQADFLLRDLAAHHPERQAGALARIRRALPRTRSMADAAVRESIRHSNALEVIAHEQHYPSWVHLSAGQGEGPGDAELMDLMLARSGEAVAGGSHPEDAAWNTVMDVTRDISDDDLSRLACEAFPHLTKRSILNQYADAGHESHGAILQSALVAYVSHALSRDGGEASPEADRLSHDSQRDAGGESEGLQRTPALATEGLAPGARVALRDRRIATIVRIGLAGGRIGVGLRTDEPGVAGRWEYEVIDPDLVADLLESGTGDEPEIYGDIPTGMLREGDWVAMPNRKARRVQQVEVLYDGVVVVDLGWGQRTAWPGKVSLARGPRPGSEVRLSSGRERGVVLRIPSAYPGHVWVLSGSGRAAPTHLVPESEIRSLREGEHAVALPQYVPGAFVEVGDSVRDAVGEPRQVVDVERYDDGDVTIHLRGGGRLVCPHSVELVERSA